MIEIVMAIRKYSFAVDIIYLQVSQIHGPISKTTTLLGSSYLYTYSTHAFIPQCTLYNRLGGKYLVSVYKQDVRLVERRLRHVICLNHGSGTLGPLPKEGLGGWSP